MGEDSAVFRCRRVRTAGSPGESRPRL